SNKVLASIMGEKGLARRGWLVKMGQKLYALTREGRQVVRKLLHEGGEAPAAGAAGPVKLSKEQEKFLQTLFASSALEKLLQGHKQDINFADASRFWGFTQNVQGEAVESRLTRVRASLADVDRLLGAGGTAVLSNGRSVSGEEVGQLCDLHTYMEEKFDRVLSLLRSRAGRS